MLKILGAGGGTKGHAFPLQEILKEIKEREPDLKIWIAGVKEFEKEIARSLEADFFQLKLSGLPRRLSFGLVVVPVKAFIETLKLYFYLKKERPDAVVVTGGYTSFPAAMASLLFKSPLYLHEQNAIPGLVNRIFARRAEKIFLSLPLEERYLKGLRGKAVLSGNPVRKEALAELNALEAKKILGLSLSRPTVLAFGGSQGARSLNNAVLRLALWMVEKRRNDFQLILLTGRNNYEAVLEEAKAHLQERKMDAFSGLIRIFPERQDMGLLYSAADLVISRSGASTVAEIIAAGKPAVLVPYPFAAGNHQYYNALYLVKQRAGVLVEDERFSGFSPEKLFSFILEVLGNKELFLEAKRLKEERGNKLPQAVIADIILSDLRNSVRNR